ncbi:MAG TPA: superoxide dismutase [Bacteriovoracaceae bacterium]|nr:superoxide dismutase [Bacteriovoracaceae bacterium]
MEFILPPLPFNKASLKPFMSAETLEFHHGKHHKAYVEKLNTLLSEQAVSYRSLEEIICSTEGKLFNNAAQAWNHTFFWHCLSQSARHDSVSEELNSKIGSTFGSMEKMKEKFNQTAEEVFGTGWCWLVKDTQHGQLKIIGTNDAENPITKGLIPLLVCDMWEHSYYLDYRNSREKYLEGFWQIINWEFVSDRFHDTKIVNLTEEMTNKPETTASL